MELRFPPPTLPWSVNAVPGSVRAKIALSKRKQAWRDAAYYTAYAKNLRAVPPSNVRVSIPFTTTRRRDPHNYVGTVVKAVIDGLVLAKVWPDDNPEWVTVLEPELVVGSGEVVVTIEPR